MALAEFRSALLKDTQFQRYKSIRDTAIRSLNYEALADEVQRIQDLRINSLKENIKPRELLTLSMKEADHRGRLTKILVAASRSRADLSTVGDEMWMYAYARYAEHLADIRVKSDREAAVTACFKAGNEFIARMDALISLCEATIKDIDQSSYHLNRTAAMFELIIRHDKLVNVEV